MPFVFLDDEFHSNPKVLQAGLEGAGLYARALSYCGAYLTNGFVPQAWAEAAVGRKGDRLLALLEQIGLWNACPGGYEIPDYLEFNPSREDVKKRRAERSQSGKKGARSRWGHGNSHSESHSTSDSSSDSSSHGSSHGKTMARGRAAPAPSLNPGPEEQKAEEDSVNGSSNAYFADETEGLPVEKERLALQLKAAAPVSDDGARTIDHLCLALPEGALAKVLESTLQKKMTEDVGPGYVINALRSELSEMAAR
jgi:hypothetical protein